MKKKIGRPSLPGAQIANVLIPFRVTESEERKLRKLGKKMEEPYLVGVVRRIVREKLKEVS